MPHYRAKPALRHRMPAQGHSGCASHNTDLRTINELNHSRPHKKTVKAERLSVILIYRFIIRLRLIFFIWNIISFMKYFQA